MTVTQLWAYPQPSPGPSLAVDAVAVIANKTLLDTYPLDPIKVTFSSESVTDLTAITSAYSQVFRLPATATNDKFFKWIWSISSTDFDVTKKVRAELQIESGFFIEGHIRLQKIFRNFESTIVDYEVLFLGEVSDFSSQVGDGFMDTINLNHLSHPFSWASIQTSWTGDLLSGDIRYPLVEWGYDYNSDGTSVQTQITTSPASSKRFTLSAHPLAINQWRPWVRAKAVIDAIFAGTEYTYTSSFFDSATFANLYTNCSGNIETPVINPLLISNELSVVGSGTYPVDLDDYYVWQWQFVISDPGGNWNPSNSTFTAPLAGDYTWGSTGFSGLVTWTGPFGVDDVTIELVSIVNGTPTLFGSASVTAPNSWIAFDIPYNETFTLQAGDVVQWAFRVTSPTLSALGLFPNIVVSANSSVLTLINAEQSVNPGVLLSNTVKKIDWFRSILTKFRLVMVPDRNNSQNFIIETWNDWIGSGESLDWTSKLDTSKDVQIDPLFFDQNNILTFTDAEDSDYPNKNNIDAFKEVYGTRIYTSGNELLKGSRSIQTQIAPTPVQRVTGGETSADFIIPSIARLEPVGEQSTGGLLKPIVAKPRLLFWNGIADTGGTEWYADNGIFAQSFTTYPRMTYVSEFEPVATSLNLNWEIEPGRWIAPPDGTIGVDVWTAYWKDYIESLYSPQARKMTAYFLLDSQDLKVEFNDNIFIRDSWWRVIKIYNAPLSGLNPVKVDLIRLLDAPGDDCNCEQYVVTDLRNEQLPFAWPFTYINCTTGLPVNDTILGGTKFACACEPFDTGNKLVVVTATGNTTCGSIPVFQKSPSVITPEPGFILDVLVEAEQLVDLSGSDWVSVASDPVEPGPPVEIEYDLTRGSGVRLGILAPFWSSGLFKATVEWFVDGVSSGSQAQQITNAVTYFYAPEVVQADRVLSWDISLEPGSI